MEEYRAALCNCKRCIVGRMTRRLTKNEANRNFSLLLRSSPLEDWHHVWLGSIEDRERHTWLQDGHNDLKENTRRRNLSRRKLIATEEAHVAEQKVGNKLCRSKFPWTSGSEMGMTYKGARARRVSLPGAGISCTPSKNPPPLGKSRVLRPTRRMTLADGACS